MDLQRALLADPTLFAQNIDFLRQMVLFVQCSSDAYRNASFLDGRMLTPQTRKIWASFSDLDAISEGAPGGLPVHFIFHSGHVGSTLLSRLLDCIPGVFGLREPLPMRQLAEAGDALDSLASLVSPAQFDALLAAQVRLWRRGYAHTTAAVVKATSTAARLGSRLLGAAPSAKAICLNLPLEPYLATLLAGENSIFDLRGHGSERMRRLQKTAQLVTPLHAMSVGDLAALAWVVETTTHAQLKTAFGDRVLALNFEALLADPAAALRSVCSHFELTPAENLAERIARSGVMQRYAKAPEAPYSPALRNQLLTQARALHASEIARGRRWIEELTTRSPQLNPLLASAA
jgi:hypothetical protein